MKNITKQSTIQDILDMVDEPKEINVSDLETIPFYKKYKDWDGEIETLRLLRLEQGETRTTRKKSLDQSFNHIASVDTKYPIIVSTINRQYSRIIDGHHQTLKTIQTKSPVIKVRVLDLDKFSCKDGKFNMKIVILIIKILFGCSPSGMRTDNEYT